MLTRLSLPAAAALAAGVLQPAAARPLEAELPPGGATVCYERVYDKAHLAAHPRQRVTRIMLIYEGRDEGEDDPRGAFVTLMMNVRNRVADDGGFDYRLTGVCAGRAGGLACANEWNAGAWRIEKASGGGLLVRNGGTLLMNPYVYDAEDLADDHVEVPAEPDDRAWKLARAPASACKP